jgi:Terminase small subunit
MKNHIVKEARLLTEKQLHFVLAWSGNAVSAARQAGYTNPERSAQDLVKDPGVRNALQRKQEAMAKESGKSLQKRIQVSRIDLINRLWEVAQMSPRETSGSIHGQIKASEILAGILCMHLNRSPNIPQELEGKTQDDMDHFLAHGYFPEGDIEPEAPEAPEASESPEAQSPEA